MRVVTFIVLGIMAMSLASAQLEIFGDNTSDKIINLQSPELPSSSVNYSTAYVNDSSCWGGNCNTSSYVRKTGDTMSGDLWISGDSRVYFRDADQFIRSTNTGLLSMTAFDEIQLQNDEDVIATIDINGMSVNGNIQSTGNFLGNGSRLTDVCLANGTSCQSSSIGIADNITAWNITARQNLFVKENITAIGGVKANSFTVDTTLANQNYTIGMNANGYLLIEQGIQALNPTVIIGRGTTYGGDWSGNLVVNSSIVTEVVKIVSRAPQFILNHTSAGIRARMGADVDGAFFTTDTPAKRFRLLTVNASGTLSNTLSVYQDKVGIGVFSPSVAKLQIASSFALPPLLLTANTTNMPCSATYAGALYYDGSLGKHRGCNSTGWQNLY